MRRKETRQEKIEKKKTFWMVFRGVFKTIGCLGLLIFLIAVVFFSLMSLLF